jgi:hypothetical protein
MNESGVETTEKIVAKESRGDTRKLMQRRTQTSSESNIGTVEPWAANVVTTDDNGTYSVGNEMII